MATEIFDLLIECVVNIQTDRNAGTGFFVSPGLILTCAHVVSNASRIIISYKTSKYPATIEFAASDNYPDLALLSIQHLIHPCVFLDEEFIPGDNLHIHGFPGGEHLKRILKTGLMGVCEGKAFLDEAEQEELITFRSTQVVPGFSGSPVMNVRTQKVCGIVKRTRDDTRDLGGRAIPTSIIFSSIPNLKKLQSDYHARNDRWISLSTKEGVVTPSTYSNAPTIDTAYWLHQAKELCRLPELTSSITIDRSDMMRNLLEFATHGHGMVVGDAGVGKTYSMRNLGLKLIEQGIPCIYLSAGDLNTWNDLNQVPHFSGDFNRDDDLKNYLDSVKSAFDGKQPIILIDAFDAAHSRTKRNFVLDMAKTSMQANTTVLISTRLYDAESSVQLKQLFPENNVTTVSAIFQTDSIHSRHFLIPRLTQNELQEVLLEIPPLLVLYQRCGISFQELLRTPFNLMLTDILRQETPEVLDAGCVSSETELLEVYWKHRVWMTEFSIDTRSILRKMCSQMVDDRVAFVNINDYIETTEQLDAIEHLLSVQILVYQPDSQDRLSFAHKLLFDYIISILLIPEDIVEFIRFFSTDPTRTIYLIPSARYYFTRLWLHNRTQFWRISLYSLPPDTERHLKLFTSFLPPSLIVDMVQNAEDLFPLVEAVGQQKTQAYIGVRALLKMAVFIQKRGSFSCEEGKSIETVKVIEVNQSWSALWLDFIENLLSFVSLDIAPDMAIMAKFILDTSEQNYLERLGHFSHRLFKWSFERTKPTDENSAWHQWFLDRHVLTLITLTYGTNSHGARSLLRSAVDATLNRALSIDVIYRIIMNFDHFVTIDPEFVGTIYSLVFGSTEDSDEPTHMGGIIIPMTSTRRQDFESLHYLLVHYFQKYLQQFPLLAARAMSNSLNRFLAIQRSSKVSNAEVKTFPIRDKQARFVPVHHFGHRSGNLETDPEHMADLVFDLMLQLSRDDDSYGVLIKLVDELLVSLEASYLWGKLIEIATHNPEFFTRLLFEILTSPPIIDSFEIYHELRSFIAVAAEHLTVRQLRVIEEKLLAENKNQLREAEIRDREILIASIPVELLQTELAKQVHARYHHENSLPPNVPAISFGGFTSRALTDYDWAEEVGVNLDERPNQDLRSLWLPIQQLIQQWRNKVPERAVWLAEYPSAKSLYQNLKSTAINADEEVSNRAWTELAEYVEILSQFSSELDEETFEFCREVMLECAVHPDPGYDPARDENYDFPPSWSPAPRIEAAQGLIWLAHRQFDPTLQEAIETLSMDLVTPIRFLVANHLSYLYHVSEKFFWDIIQERGRHEINEMVWAGLLDSLGRVRNKSEAQEIIQSKMKATFDQSNQIVFKYLIPLTLWYAVDQQVEWALKIVDEYKSNPQKYPEQLNELNTSLHSWIKPEHLYNDSSQISHRAISVLDEIIKSSFVGADAILVQGWAQISAEQKEILKTLSRINENTISWLLSGSGLRDQESNNALLSPEMLSAFYFAIKPILSRIATTTNDRTGIVISAYASHNFIELLNGVLDLDAADVFHMAAQIVEASQKSGYQFDSLAVREVVKVVCKALADHKYLFAHESGLNDLIVILDVFYQAGWPEAFHLVSRLHEIFE